MVLNEIFYLPFNNLKDKKKIFNVQRLALLNFIKSVNCSSSPDFSALKYFSCHGIKTLETGMYHIYNCSFIIKVHVSEASGRQN